MIKNKMQLIYSNIAIIFKKYTLLFITLTIHRIIHKVKKLPKSWSDIDFDTYLKFEKIVELTVDDNDYVGTFDRSVRIIGCLSKSDYAYLVNKSLKNQNNYYMTNDWSFLSAEPSTDNGYFKIGKNVYNIYKSFDRFMLEDLINVEIIIERADIRGLDYRRELLPAIVRKVVKGKYEPFDVDDYINGNLTEKIVTNIPTDTAFYILNSFMKWRKDLYYKRYAHYFKPNKEEGVKAPDTKAKLSAATVWIIQIKQLIVATNRTDVEVKKMNVIESLEWLYINRDVDISGK